LAPAVVAEREVAETISFATAAQRVEYADPSEVEEHLRRGTRAFLRKDYASAHCILGALLVPIGKCEIDLGQAELVEEVLSPDTLPTPPVACPPDFSRDGWVPVAVRQRTATRGFGTCTCLAGAMLARNRFDEVGPRDTQGHFRFAKLGN
jgi:hypothetical protein